MAFGAAHGFYRIIRSMKAVDIYLKVETDLDESEVPAKFAAELCRALERIYGVRRAEVMSLHEHEPEGGA